MARDVKLVLATTRQDIPAGITPNGSYLYSVGDSIPTQTVAAKTATFAQLAPGDYTATVQGLDASGAPFGPVASASFTVPDDTGGGGGGNPQWDAPDVLTVTVGDAAAAA